MNKILLPSDGDKSQIILDDTTIVPEGYHQYWLSDTQWTLIDNRGRINISWVYSWAKTVDPNMTDKSPNKWLRTKSVKVLRGNYKDIIGYDPVKTIRGGKRGDYQRTYSAFDNSSFQNISANGNVQTYGTYMTDRMFVTYAGWVSFEFKRYVDDIFIRNANNAVSASGLILSTDELHHENDAVNQRHGMLRLSEKHISDNLKAPTSMIRTITDYVDWLRGDYNIDISVTEYLRYMQHIGVMYKDGLLLNGEVLDMYKPKQEYITTNCQLFAVAEGNINGLDIQTTFITEYGHNCTIQDIVNKFGEIE